MDCILRFWGQWQEWDFCTVFVMLDAGLVSIVVRVEQLPDRWCAFCGIKASFSHDLNFALIVTVILGLQLNYHRLPLPNMMALECLHVHTDLICVHFENFISKLGDIFTSIRIFRVINIIIHDLFSIHNKLLFFIVLRC